ncbi:hypothetical protein PROFUN_16325 [Planoprotostelium fungivorum]|uniref:Uncharacterized protein n=1 Tax=Planoprotostelium fungivorum TaxID=1890364 RepID=A0A2P6MR26_9EUKA|nr:hypothetical protein PROFUN_16325 [Planoprotostelium fungivorum]
MCTEGKDKKFIWLDPSTTSNSIEGLYRSASRHNIFKLEFTVDDIRNFYLINQLTRDTYVSTYNVNSRNTLYYLDHLSNGRWTLQTCRTLLIPLQNKQGQTIASTLDYIFRIK